MGAIWLHLDLSTLEHDPRYMVSVPLILWSSVGLAAVVPASLIMTSKLPWVGRIGLTIAMLCLLALEFGMTVWILVLKAGT